MLPSNTVPSIEPSFGPAGLVDSAGAGAGSRMTTSTPTMSVSPMPLVDRAVTTNLPTASLGTGSFASQTRWSSALAFLPLVGLPLGLGLGEVGLGGLLGADDEGSRP